MSATMNWTISTLERELSDGGVIVAHWRCTASDGGLTVSSYGTCSFEQKDPSDPNFIPFDALTEEVVIGWVRDKMGEGIEANLNSAMDALENPTSATGVPW